MNTATKVMKLVLPENFQETVITYEMKFEKGDKNVNLVRNLLYLYSLGTEYYDSINNDKLYQYYQDKSIKLITNDEVINILENDQKRNKYLKANSKVDVFTENPLRIIDKEDLPTPVYSFTDGNINSFTDSYELELRESTSARETYSETLGSLEPSPSPRKHLKKKLSLKQNYMTEPRTSSNLLEKELQNEKSNLMIKLTHNISKAEESYSKDLSNQLDSFERKKREKLRKQSEKTLRNKPFIKRHETTLKACLNPRREDTMNILNNIMELSEKKIVCIQRQMQLELEAFINSNLEEMYKNLDELKETFEKEIKHMEDNGYPHVCKSLQEEMKVELEGLKEQYEEQRRQGIEKINLKYNKLLK